MSENIGFTLRFLLATLIAAQIRDPRPVFESLLAEHADIVSTRWFFFYSLVV